MSPEEIRALYVEALARIVYERTQKAMNYPMNMPPWEVPPGEAYDRDGITVVQVGKFDPRRRYRAQAALDVDALAALGLLPKYMDRRNAYQPNGDSLGYFERQFLTEWRRMDDSCPACRVTWNDCRPPDYRCCPDCRHPLREAAG